MLLTALVFLLILSILVLVHEFGHFITGKAVGVGVLEFALGLPFTKPLWSKKVHSGMRVSLYPILFGGFVRILGEEGSEEERKGVSGKYFYQVGVWRRIAVVVSGVSMNFVLAVAVFYLYLFLTGFKTLIPVLADYQFLSPHRTYAAITFVQEDSPAKRAGLSSGEVVLSVDGRRFDRSKDFQSYIKKRAGNPVTIQVSDENFERSRAVLVTPRVSPPPTQGALGVGIATVAAINFSTISERLLSGLTYTLDMLFYNLKVLSFLIFSSVQTGNVSVLSESVSGPVGILDIVSKIIGIGGKEAILGLVRLLGILSISLAFVNILPFPALDGGKLALLLVEAVFGKRLAAKNEALINQVGMVILLGLIVLISYNDLMKWFKG